MHSSSILYELIHNQLESKESVHSNSRARGCSNCAPHNSRDRRSCDSLAYNRDPLTTFCCCRNRDWEQMVGKIALRSLIM